MSRDRMIKPRCEDCPHKQALGRYGNKTKEVFCNHPDRGYIQTYFEQHNISKFPTFLGYINAKGVFPVKQSPKWCPLKKEGGESDA